MLARQYRTRPRIVNERYRVRDACLAAEQRHGIGSTAPADRTAARASSRAETGKAARHGRGEPPRTTLRRHVATAAASAASVDQFFAGLDEAGILVRLRYSTRNPGQVTGVRGRASRRHRHDTASRSGTEAASSPPTCPGPSSPSGGPARPAPTPRRHQYEAYALWDYAARTAADATARIRTCTAAGNPAAAADAASAASDTLYTAVCRARQPHPAPRRRQLRTRRPPALGARPRPDPGRQPAPPRRPADLRLLLPHRGRAALPWVVLLLRLAALAEAVAEMRESQQRAAQAAAALRAARVARH